MQMFDMEAVEMSDEESEDEFDYDF